MLLMNVPSIVNGLSQKGRDGARFRKSYVNYIRQGTRFGWVPLDKAALSA
jgi:hypothetical protein